MAENGVKVSTLKSGRDLDALVSERVMGWKRVGSNSYLNFDQYVKIGDQIPPYSTDISAAWEVVEKVLALAHPCQYPWPNKTKAPYGFRLERETENQTGCGVWFCQFPETTAAPPHEEMNPGVSAEAGTAPLAICLAALKAVGVDS